MFRLCVQLFCGCCRFLRVGGIALGHLINLFNGLADLNGDGTIEIIAKETYRGRSFGYVVYDFEKESSDPSLYIWCGD